MDFETPTKYHSDEHVLRGTQLHWFMWDRKEQEKTRYREVRDLHQKWRDMNPWKFTTQSKYALELVHEMIGAYTQFLIYTHQSLEDNVVLKSLYNLLNEGPSHLPPQSSAQPAGLFLL